jgi:hypothetical protein
MSRWPRAAVVVLGGAVLLAACSTPEKHASSQRTLTGTSVRSTSSTAIITAPPTLPPESTTSATSGFTSTTATNVAATATATSGGLSIRVTATPSNGQIGTAVAFTITATETHAPGALHYLIAYGDGETASNPTDEVCVAGPGPAANESWSLSHNYLTPSTYTVTVTVGVNCSPDSAEVQLKVSPRAT